MSVSNIEEGLVADVSDSRIEVDAVHIGIGVGDFLHEKWSTVTKVVLPVPDIPMAMRQQL